MLGTPSFLLDTSEFLCSRGRDGTRANPLGPNVGLQGSNLLILFLEPSPHIVATSLELLLHGHHDWPDLSQSVHPRKSVRLMLLEVSHTVGLLRLSLAQSALAQLILFSKSQIGVLLEAKKSGARPDVSPLQTRRQVLGNPSSVRKSLSVYFAAMHC